MSFKSTLLVYLSTFEPPTVIDCVLLEHESLHKTVQLPETVDLDEPDEKSEIKEEVCYFIVGGNAHGVFSVDRIDHTLRVCFCETGLKWTN